MEYQEHQAFYKQQVFYKQRKKEIYYERTELKMLFKDIAQKHGISQQRVRTIFNGCVRELKRKKSFTFELHKSTKTRGFKEDIYGVWFVSKPEDVLF